MVSFYVFVLILQTKTIRAGSTIIVNGRVARRKPTQAMRHEGNFYNNNRVNIFKQIYYVGSTNGK